MDAFILSASGLWGALKQVTWITSFPHFKCFSATWSSKPLQLHKWNLEFLHRFPLTQLLFCWYLCVCGGGEAQRLGLLLLFSLSTVKKQANYFLNVFNKNIVGWPILLEYWISTEIQNFRPYPKLEHIVFMYIHTCVSIKSKKHCLEISFTLFFSLLSGDVIYLFLHFHYFL